MHLRYLAAPVIALALATTSCKHEAPTANAQSGPTSALPTLPTAPKPPTGPTYTLRFPTKLAFTMAYNLRRLDTTRPKWRVNSDWDESFKLLITGRPAQGGDMDVDVRVTDVGGKNTSFVVKEMAPEIEKGEIGRSFNEFGVLSRWAPLTYSNAGYSGMDADRGIGEYEVGFLELNYPKAPVPVGAKWTATVRVGNEAYESDQVRDVKGNDAVCTYRLVSVDPAKSTAEIAFSFDTQIRGTAPPMARGMPETLLSMHDSGSGKWLIDLNTGLPITFNSDRTTETTEGGNKVTERYQSIIQATK